jgi:hypothetical protein
VARVAQAAPKPMSRYVAGGRCRQQGNRGAQHSAEGEPDGKSGNSEATAFRVHVVLVLLLVGLFFKVFVVAIVFVCHGRNSGRDTKGT